MDKKRNTKVIKSVERNIWTAKYEGLRVNVSFEEDVEWSDLNERQDKLDAITKHLNNELIRTLNAACDELGVVEKKVFKANDPEKDADKHEISFNFFDPL